MNSFICYSEYSTTHFKHFMLLSSWNCRFLSLETNHVPVLWMKWIWIRKSEIDKKSLTQKQMSLASLKYWKPGHRNYKTVAGYSFLKDGKYCLVLRWMPKSAHNPGRKWHLMDIYTLSWIVVFRSDTEQCHMTWTVSHDSSQII